MADSAELLSDYTEVKKIEIKSYEDVFHDNLAAAKSSKEALAKAEFQAFKAKTNVLVPAYDARKAFIKKIPKFWATVFQNYGPMQAVIDPVDQGALEHVKDFHVDYKEDPREYDLTFEFGSDNPFFSNSKLIKSFKLAEASHHSDKSIDIASLQTYDLRFPLQTSSVNIDWTSDDHNLVKKKPRIDPSGLEEFDEFEGLGSFFNFFTEASDPLDVGEHLLDCYANAVDLYAGLASGEGDSSDDDSMDGDPNAEIDIEESDDEKKPAKKRQRKA